MRYLLLATLAITFVAASSVTPVEAKSRSACTKQVSKMEKYLTPGGRCGESCRAAIDRCVRGRKI